MQYASFGKRLVAYLIDSFIVSLIVGIPTGCLVGILSTTAMSMDEELFVIIMLGVMMIAMVWGIIASTLYYALMWSRSGQTLGKKWLGIKVITAEWTPPSFWRAAGRAVLGYWLSSLIFSLGFLWMLWDDYQQCWHDKLFSTYVIEV